MKGVASSCVCSMVMLRILRGPEYHQAIGAEGKRGGLGSVTVWIVETS
jgi:hypothetical protein